MKPKLSKNEKNVLKLLIQNGRMRCTEIARKLDLTPQGVGKILKKLESSGIIQGYSTIVDYEKIGIEVFAIALFRFKSGLWTRIEEEDIKERVKGPHLIRVYRVPEGDVTHIVVYGFRSLHELDHYFHILQTEREHISELKKLYVFSSKSIMKDSPNDLLLKVLEELGKEKLARPEPPKPLTRN